MAKKFGKFLLFTAAAAAACAGVYYYLQSKGKLAADYNGDEDDDYDDFSDDLDEQESNRSYVALNHENADAEQKEAPAEEEKKEEAPFEKLSSLVSAAEDKAEKVEEFFDEDEDTTSEK